MDVKGNLQETWSTCLFWFQNGAVSSVATPNSSPWPSGNRGGLRAWVLQDPAGTWWRVGYRMEIPPIYHLKDWNCWSFGSRSSIFLMSNISYIFQPQHMMTPKSQTISTSYQAAQDRAAPLHFQALDRCLSLEPQLGFKLGLATNATKNGSSRGHWPPTVLQKDMCVASISDGCGHVEPLQRVGRSGTCHKQPRLIRASETVWVMTSTSFCRQWFLLGSPTLTSLHSFSFFPTAANQAHIVGLPSPQWDL